VDEVGNACAQEAGRAHRQAGGQAGSQGHPERVSTRHAHNTDARRARSLVTVACVMASARVRCRAAHRRGRRPRG
jgi:hypothetical protein